MGVCAVRECGAKRHAKSLCRRHYDEKYKGCGKTAFAARVKENRELVAHGKKLCNYCRAVKLLTEFPPCNTSQGGRKGYCRACHYERRKSLKIEQDRRRCARQRDAATAAYLDGGEIPPHIRAEEKKLTEQRIAHMMERAAEALRFAFRHFDSSCGLKRSLAEGVFDGASIAADKPVGPWQNPELSDAEKYRLRYRHDEHFAISERVRRQVTKAKKRMGVESCMRSAICRGGDSPKVQRELGYSISDLKTHLERQFSGGMSWESFKRGEIHIDHIVPVADFDLSNDDQYRKCWCLSNLRPVWAEENLRKGARREFLV